MTLFLYISLYTMNTIKVNYFIGYIVSPSSMTKEKKKKVRTIGLGITSSSLAVAPNGLYGP